MGKVYTAWVKLFIPVEFEDDEELDLGDQALESLPILPVETSVFGVYNIEEKEI